ncbi:MAG: Stp1/IreP family PP2C-type Ser/Thr phosphatase [Acidiferrobacterales bacterium]|jgi:serine/threonine protein phosphatase PrpC|nr:Stp1/IreP family PP2C-type Ser/Thr phosphatase [Acidiferrobacterales bacterium]
MQFEMNGITHQGMVRINNEDSISTLPDMGIAILADGMGGHQAGEVASSMAVEMIKQFYSDSNTRNKGDSVEDHLREAIDLANTAVFELSQERPECAGMGTTIVVSHFVDGKIITAHVGDSRLYRLRDSGFEQITKDHSVVQELVTRGFMSQEEANSSMNKNLVTRALGIEASVEADLVQDEYKAGDVYLLCSDGLSDVVDSDTIQQTLTEHLENLDEASQKLVDVANQAGGPDNVSVVLVRVLEDGN